MSWRRATAILIAVAVVALGAYDVVAYLRGGVEATISRTVEGWAFRNPIVPFLVGVLSGHFFWAQPPTAP